MREILTAQLKLGEQVEYGERNGVKPRRIGEGQRGQFAE